MGYNVILKNGAKVVLNFWVPAFLAAQNAVISHLSIGKTRQGAIIDQTSGEVKHYFWIGEKLNISIL